MMEALPNIPLAQWPTFVEELGEKPFRAAQLAEWIFQRRAKGFDEMSNLPSGFRAKLAERFFIRSLVLVRQETSKQDGTTRLFFKTRDGGDVSCVFLPFEERR